MGNTIESPENGFTILLDQLTSTVVPGGFDNLQRLLGVQQRLNSFIERSVENGVGDTLEQARLLIGMLENVQEKID